MASLFWVGGTGTYDGTTNHFATTSGGSATVAAVTSADTVTVDSLSGSGTLTIGTTLACSTFTLNSSTLAVVCNAPLNVTTTMTLTLGSLNTNGQTCTWGSFVASTSNTRTLTLGASTLNINGGTGTLWNFSGTGATFNAGTSTVIFTGGN